MLHEGGGELNNNIIIMFFFVFFAYDSYFPVSVLVPVPVSVPVPVPAGFSKIHLPDLHGRYMKAGYDG